MASASTPPANTAVVPAALQLTRTARALRTRSPFVAALIRTVRNPMGMFGGGVSLLLVICAIGAPVLTPYDPLEQHPGAELRPPGAEYPLGTDNLGRDLL